MASFTPINGQTAAPQDPRITSLRRPTTTNEADFWYISLDNWNALAAEGPTKNTLNQLRKYDTAGRIMETNEGVVASVACDWCLNRGLTCRLMADGSSSQCGYCKRHAKANCGALLLAPPPAPPSIEHRFAALEARVVALEGELAAEKAKVAELERGIGTIGEDSVKVNKWQTDIYPWMTSIDKKVGRLFGRVFGNGGS